MSANRDQRTNPPHLQATRQRRFSAQLGVFLLTTLSPLLSQTSPPQDATSVLYQQLNNTSAIARSAHLEDAVLRRDRVTITFTNGTVYFPEAENLFHEFFFSAQHTAHGIGMSAKEFSSTVHHEIGSQSQWILIDRCGKGIVNHDHGTYPMSGG